MLVEIWSAETFGGLLANMRLFWYLLFGVPASFVNPTNFAHVASFRGRNDLKAGKLQKLGNILGETSGNFGELRGNFGELRGTSGNFGETSGKLRGTSGKSCLTQQLLREHKSGAAEEV